MKSDKIYKMVFLIDTNKIEIRNLSFDEVKFAVNFTRKNIDNSSAVLYLANTFMKINDIKAYYINDYELKEVIISDFVDLEE